MLPVGKLDSELLKQLIFNHLSVRRPEVLVRPGLGEDCAVVDCGDRVCVLSTDPITGADSVVGKLAVHINCNDIAAQGAAPLGLMLTVLAPAGTTPAQLEAVMAQAAQEASKLNVEIIGGHTEITTAVNRMVVSGVAVGFKPKAELKRGAPAPGDVLVMTKTAGLEGAGIIAWDRAQDLAGALTETELREAQAQLDQISVVPEGILGGQLGAAKMHDVTEGGILGAVWELCETAGAGCEVVLDAIPVHPVTVKICNHFGLDPYRLISSGAMLLIFSPEGAERFIREAAEHGIPAAAIGTITARERVVLQGTGSTVLAPPVGDELYKVMG